jgi:hypothetical protein
MQCLRSMSAQRTSRPNVRGRESSRYAGSLGKLWESHAFPPQETVECPVNAPTSLALANAETLGLNIGADSVHSGHG